VHDDLPVRTVIGEESKAGGLLLCGLNFGESGADEKQAANGIEAKLPPRSFFGDRSGDNYQFQNTIVKWFSLWGYDIARTKEIAGPFERSIILTNWLQSASNDAGAIPDRAYVDDSAGFLHTCDVLRPRIIFFFGQTLMGAFTSPGLDERIESIFGAKLGGTQWERRDVRHNGKLRTRFRVGFQRYERLTVVAFPHPTGCRVAHDYIEAFKDRMSEIINGWWKAHSDHVN